MLVQRLFMGDCGSVAGWLSEETAANRERERERERTVRRCVYRKDKRLDGRVPARRDHKVDKGFHNSRSLELGQEGVECSFIL